ncbi:hypothetical protein [Nonomuraea sp. 10N515B]|uniref:hypothetical protein n=1 Tax=Nonomuraea sp. 10N515B TaxID=3457422 RepID=UPI003FCD2D66
MLLAISAAAITATPAQALTNVTAIGGKLSVNAGNVGDHITINVENGALVVRNFNDTIKAGSFTCANVDVRTVRSVSSGITNILVNSQGGLAARVCVDGHETDSSCRLYCVKSGVLR